MPKITLQNGRIADFRGDAIVLPCDTDLASRKTNKWFQDVFEKAGRELLEELAAIGYSEIGNAVITKAYELGVKHIIFLSYTDHDNQENELDCIMLHKSLRSAFALARIYNLERVAIPLLETKIIKRDFLEKIIFELFSKPSKKLKSEEIMNIIIGVSNEFNNSLKEVVIYR